MENPTIFDGQNTRSMTDAEYKQWQKDQTQTKTQQKIEADRQALKLATLEKLGLTADEAFALLS